jgi:hypothetical protein
VKTIQFFTTITLLLIGTATLAAEDCQWDADAADSPDFANRIGDCNAASGRVTTPVAKPDKRQQNHALELYDNGTVEAEEIIEIPVAATGFGQHTPGKSYAVREPYSLVLGAKFEDSITLAIHRIHGKMAQYCAKGWQLDREWTEAADNRGSYYLHYAFTCAEVSSPDTGK